MSILYHVFEEADGVLGTAEYRLISETDEGFIFEFTDGTIKTIYVPADDHCLGTDKRKLLENRVIKEAALLKEERDPTVRARFQACLEQAKEMLAAL